LSPFDELVDSVIAEAGGDHQAAGLLPGLREPVVRLIITVTMRSGA
jgi:hypothetical protein